MENKIEEKESEGKKEEKKQEKPAEKAEKLKKEEAIVKGRDLSISTKHAIYICRFIRGKRIDEAREKLSKVISFKIPVPMKGEIPHRKGKIKGKSGRYPINACKIFLKLLKSLEANSNVNSIENPYIHIAKADLASRPYKRGGSQRFKRTNVLLVAKEKKVEEKK